ncbi:dolichol kinase [Apiospora sp. TS-2023a]
MPEQLDPSTAAQNPRDDSNEEHDDLRLLSRSPHPYARQKFELLEPSGSFAYPPRGGPAARAGLDGTHPQRATTFPSVARDTSASSDSGTEADDEHFLKGLPAPKARLHKGLRGRNELASGTSTPLPSPGPFDDDDGRRHFSRIACAEKGCRDRKECADCIRKSEAQQGDCAATCGSSATRLPWSCCIYKQTIPTGSASMAPR